MLRGNEAMSLSIRIGVIGFGSIGRTQHSLILAVYESSQSGRTIRVGL